jgi:hypothetical protein
MNYIIAYTLKHKENPDTFEDSWMVYKEEDGFKLEDVKKMYQSIIDKDGMTDGWYLWTIALSIVIESSDH